MNDPIHKTLYDIVIAGGGASGMAAAVCAGRFFAQKKIIAKIALVERHGKLGRKVAATGNGRCNLSHLDAADCKSVHYYSEYPPLYEAVLEKFGPEQTIRFFESMGILCKVTDEKKVYPFCEQAVSVIHAFLQELSAYHVDILLEHEINEINEIEGAEDNFPEIQRDEYDSIEIPRSRIVFKVTGNRLDPAMTDSDTKLSRQAFCLHARRIIMATGGKASPALSSDGSGYRLLHSLSHTSTPLFPAIVQLKTETDFVAPLAGLKWNAGISLMRVVMQDGEKSEMHMVRQDGEKSGMQTVQQDGEKPAKMVRECLRKESGELLFTKYGISGPPVLQLSRHFGRYAGKEKRVVYYAVIDFLETFSTPDLIVLLSNRIHAFGERHLRDLLVGIVPFKLAAALIKKVFPHRENHPFSSITEQDLAALVVQLKMFPLQITGTTGWEEAQVTAGGIRCDEVNPQTLESRFNRGLYIAGEILDVDGDCGGYNLQFAWASGYIAGENAARSLGSEKFSENDRLCRQGDSLATNSANVT